MKNIDILYENEYGTCAYVAGAIDVETTNLNTALYNVGVEYEALSSDVFCTGPCDESAVKSYLTERIAKYLKDENATEQEFEKATAEIHKLKVIESNKLMKDAISDLYQSKADADKAGITKAIENYCRHINNYLGKPQTVYITEKESLEPFGVISQTYMYVLFDIIFVKFESHLLMFLRGSAE